MNSPNGQGGTESAPTAGGRTKAGRYAELVIPGVIVGIVVGLVISLVTGAWRPFHSNLTRTTIHLFSPQEDGWKLSSRYSTVSRAKGECFPGASMAPQPETYRCIGERQIYQTCWGIPVRPLICIWSPWSDSATLLHVEAFHRTIGHPESLKTLRWSPASDRQPPDGLFAREPLVDITSERPPWAFALTNDQRCVRVSGATYVIGGQRANYLCNDGTPGSDGPGQLNWVIGDPDRMREPWEVRYRAAGETETIPVQVVEAWF